MIRNQLVIDPGKLAILILSTLLAAVLVLASARAQDGPPQHVRDAVDGAVELLRSDSSDAAALFVDTIMTDMHPAERADLVEQVEAIRSTIGGFPDDIAVEGRPGGVTLVLQSSDAAWLLDLDIIPSGVTRIALREQSMEPPTPALTAAGRADQHMMAVEQIHRMDWEQFASEHLSESYRTSMDANDLERLREQLVDIASTATGAGVGVQGEVYILTLGGPDGRWAIAMTVEGTAPFGINSIEITDADASLSLPEITPDNLHDVLEMAENAGLDGLAYVNVSGEELARVPLGFADRSRGRPMAVGQIFGTGSQPIDYTVTLALIAADQGHLDLEAPISRYVGAVPDDKASMTVRHLLENTSGLPDFVDNENDWDPDLAWISRDEFVQRILEAPLRFTPGAQRGHSHAAFSFLAAIVEIATGQDYYDYLKEQVLEPAGMTRTGMYGDRMGHAVEDFAVGGGPRRVGLPNIPPNWGPTSWLVKGSGGMYSTLDDLIRFTEFVQSSDQLPASVPAFFSGESVNFNGSMRGFELFEYRNDGGNLILLFSNSEIQNETYADLAERLAQFGARYSTAQ